MPKAWISKRIGELGRVVTGKTPSTKTPENFDGPYPFITIPDLDGRVYITETSRTLSEKGALAIQGAQLPAGAVMISCIATVGRCGITSKPSFTNQQINSVIPNNTVDARFLYYAFTQLGKELERAGGGGSVYTNVSKSRFSNILVRIPSRLSEQREIAAILGALDDKIELNRRMCETLEEISATIFKAWRQDSGIGQGPVEGTLADIIEFDPPERLRKGIEAPYLGLAHIPNSGMIHEAPDTRAYTSGARFRDGDTLFARITPSLENGKTAIALGLGSNTIAWGSTELIVMRPKKQVPALVPYLISRDPAFRAHAVQNMSGTSGRQRVPREALMRYAFPASSHQDWQYLNRLLSPVVDAVWTRAQESRILAELRDALLPKLISGELRIPEAEQLVSEVA